MYLKKLTLMGDHDDGGLLSDGDTELVVVGNARLTGHAESAFSMQIKFDNDADGDTSKEVLVFNQLILTHVTCSPPPPVEVVVLLIEDDGSSGTIEAIAEIVKAIAAATQTPQGRAIQIGISIAEALAKLIGPLINPNDFLGGVKTVANPEHEGTSTASGTTSVTGSEVEIEIQRKIISSTCEEPGCETNYKNSTYEGIMSLPDDELLRKPLEEDLMNLNSHLIGSHYFNPDLFSNGTAAIEMLPYLTANDTESWTAEELETWKTNFTEAVTEILMNSTTTVHELALLFGNYTADPEYLNEMQWASQELTEAIIDLTAGNTTLGYEHLHMSWQHSWNAMLLADTTPPHVCICSEKTYAWLQTPYELGGFCGHDIAGPVEYECLKEYNWNFGDGFGDSGIRVLHNYTALGTYQAVLLGLDRSDNSNTTSRQVRVTIRVDINGDWKVDVKDLATAAKAFGTCAGPPVSLRWNPDVDIDANGKIDMKDIAKVAREFGWHYP